MLIFHGKNRVTQPYNFPNHWGIDIVGDESQTVRSASDGIVQQIYRWDGHTKTGTQSYGNLVIVSDGKRLLYYAHLKVIQVAPGQRLEAGQTIGIMGNTGNSFGAHTHFEVRSLNRKKHYDPAEYLGIPNKVGTYREKNGWVERKPDWYWYEDGLPVKNAWRLDQGRWYYLGASGKMLTGIARINGKYYHFNEFRQYGIPKGALTITNEKGEIKGVK